MKLQVNLVRWPAGMPSGVKETVVAWQPGVDLLAARQQYARTAGFSLLAERQDGLIALYWDGNNRLVRLAIEPA